MSLLDTILRSTGRATLLRGGRGPRGQAAGQDVGWVFNSALGPGEVSNFPPLPHAATFAAIYAHSDSGFAGTKILTIQQVRAGTVIASATLSVGAAATDWQGAISPPLAFAVADVPRLVLPNPADGQCVDLSVSLGSTP